MIKQIFSIFKAFIIRVIVSSSVPTGRQGWNQRFLDFFRNLIDRQVPRKPRLIGGVKGHNINDISSPGSPVLWTGSFKWMDKIGRDRCGFERVKEEFDDEANRYHCKTE